MDNTPSIPSVHDLLVVLDAHSDNNAAAWVLREELRGGRMLPITAVRFLRSLIVGTRLSRFFSLDRISGQEIGIRYMRRGFQDSNSCASVQMIQGASQ